MNKLLKYTKQTIGILILSATTLYFYEKSKPVKDYFKYYGNVPAKATFEYPDIIESFTFGYSERPIEIEFTNGLWCAPIDSNRTPVLIGTRIKTVDSFTFKNELPEGMSRIAIDARNQLSQIGLYDANTLRNNGVDYSTWDLAELKPDVSSTCHTTAKVQTYSDMFRFPKVVYFNAGPFEYIVKPTTEVQ